MKLSGQQRENLEKALIDAFPDKASLERMLSYRLNKNLNQVAGESDLATVVFNLIKAANAEGWIKDLVCEASQYNPGNLLLKEIATELLTDNPTPSTSNNIKTQNEQYNSSKEDAIAEYRNEFEEYLADDGNIDELELTMLGELRRQLKISEETARAVQNEVREKFAQYKNHYTELVCKQGYPLRKEFEYKLKALQQRLNLKDNTILLITETVSEKGVDYTKLRNFLRAGQWKQADEETFAVMLKVTGREEKGWLNSESIENFPCTDLRTIDQLWVKYSNGRFGFSVQKRIWESVGEDYEKFGDRVGWRKGRLNKEWITYSEVTFDTTAGWGHLPVFVGLWGVGIRGMVWVSSLASRLVNCKL